MNADEPQTLREVALRASDRHDGARGRALDRIAKERGLTLSYTTVDKIIAGAYRSQPKRETLDALAVLSGYSREQVYAAAGEPMPMQPFAEQLPADADLLTPEQRTAVLGIMRQFTSLNRALGDVTIEEAGGEHARSAPMNQAGQAPADRSTVDTVDDEITQPRRAEERTER